MSDQPRDQPRDRPGDQPEDQPEDRDGIAAMVLGAQFDTRRGEVYEMDEVDDLLDRIAKAGSHHELVVVLIKEGRPTPVRLRVRTGYAMADVDRLLDQVTARAGGAAMPPADTSSAGQPAAHPEAVQPEAVQPEAVQSTSPSSEIPNVIEERTGLLGRLFRRR